MDTGQRITMRLKELRAEREKRLAVDLRDRRLKAGFNRQGRLVTMERR